MYSKFDWWKVFICQYSRCSFPKLNIQIKAKIRKVRTQNYTIEGVSRHFILFCFIKVRRSISFYLEIPIVFLKKFDHWIIIYSFSVLRSKVWKQDFFKSPHFIDIKTAFLVFSTNHSRITFSKVWQTFYTSCKYKKKFSISGYRHELFLCGENWLERIIDIRVIYEGQRM